MKVGPAERRRVAALADRYFAEQCARLRPIDGAAAPARKRPVSQTAALKMSALAGSKVTSNSQFRAQRMGGHGGAEAGAEVVDRFRL